MTKAKFFPTTIMARAHSLARAARATGLSYRDRLSAALKASWATAKAAAARIAEQHARVQRSIDTLASDIEADKRFMAEWYAERAAAVPFRRAA